MAPSTLRKKTLSELRKTFAAMMTPEWDLALEGKSEAEITEAARTLLAVQRARLRLGNAKLAEIRDGLVEHETALQAGIEFVDEALEDLQDVERVLEATAALLAAVGRIVDIVV
ncbi:MAG: hypothetical protein ACYS15_00010 [Planctomycetota bacterium]|jgi:hypothetical protein